MESVVQIADAVAAGRVKAAAVLDEHRARYRETAKRLNALVQPRHALAGAEALQLDSMPSDSKTGQLLAGVPISIKECFPVSGLLTRWASLKGIQDRIQMRSTERMRGSSPA